MLWMIFDHPPFLYEMASSGEEVEGKGTIYHVATNLKGERKLLPAVSAMLL